MKRIYKIVLISVSIFLIIIMLDTGIARIRKSSPFISWTKELDDGSYVKQGIIIDTYYCRDLLNTYILSWSLKTNSYNCPTPQEKQDIVGVNFTRTYYIEAIYPTDDEKYNYYTLSMFQSQLDTIMIPKIDVEEHQYYEITFEVIDNFIIDDIENIFNHTKIINITPTTKTGLEQVQESFR